MGLLRGLSSVICRLSTVAALGLVSSSAWAGAVEGVLFEASTGQPVGGVRVAVAGHGATRSDASGGFSLEVPGGTWTVEVGRATVQGVRVAEEGTSELLLTLDPEGRIAHVQREEPGADPVEPEVNEDLGPPGQIKGMLSNADDGEALSGARIFVRGLAVEGSSDKKGRFELELPAGSWQLSILSEGFATLNQEVEVLAEQVVEVVLEMVPKGAALADFTISAPHVEGGTAELLEERRASGAVADVIGAEQMARSGDSDAAGALKRVTGLTVVGGRYVYVRGLGERYSSTLLNGASLPSPEPERRVVPLDMFPAALLDSVVIQKTFTPDMPAEFGGGVVMLRTRRVPTEPVLTIKLSGGYRSTTTFRDGLRYEGGATDFLGIDGDFRDLPPAVQEASDAGSISEETMFTEGFSSEELEAMGESMANRWNLHRDQTPPDLGLSVTAGNGWDLGEHSGGLLAALTYSSAWERDDWSHTYYKVGEGGSVVERNAYDFEALEHTIRLGGILTGGIDLAGGHSLTLLSMLNRNTDDEAREYQGYNSDALTTIEVGRLRWVERQLFTNQLQASHPLPGDATLEWSYTISLAHRDEPDRREYRFDAEDLEADYWLLSDRPEGNQRVYSVLADVNHDVGVDLTLPLWRRDADEDGGDSALLGLGVCVVSKERDVDTRRFKFQHKGPLSNDSEVTSKDPESIFVPENIGNDGFQLGEITRPTDNYRATQLLLSAYLMGDLTLGRDRVVAGARLESSAQSVLTFEPFAVDSEPITADLKTVDLLPAVVYTRTLTEEHLVRLGYGRTLNRPDFRELSPATFNDVTGGRQIFGNPDLERATIDNVDLRWEWYPGPGESVSMAGFYKRFTNPIESVIEASAEHSQTYGNAEGANNYGLEVEWRKTLGFVSEPLEAFYLAGNVAVIRSRVILGTDGIATSRDRALQGQSPWVINAQAGYAPIEGKLDLTVLYNHTGPRIADVGALGIPDSYLYPHARLDIVGSCELGGGWKVSARVQNILDQVESEYVGDYLAQATRSGWEGGASLSWKL